MTTATIDERRQRVASQLGIETDKVRAVALELTQLRELGALIDIDVTGLSMFSTLASYDELGIPQSDRRASRLKRGSKDLIPSEHIKALRSLAVRFRVSLDKHSFPIAGFRPYRWVPFTAYAAWKAEYERLQAELHDKRQAILDNYDGFVDALVADFTAIADEAYGAISARDDDWGEPQHEFVAGIVDRALAKLPTRERIATEIAVDYHSALVTSESDIEAERTRVDTERAAQRTAWAATEKAHAEARIADATAWNAEQDARARNRERDIKLQAMQQAELEHAREQLRQTVSPYQEVFNRLRAQMHQDVRDILAVISKHGHVPGKTAEKARGLVDTFRLLNVHGDADLETMLHAVTASLAPQPKGSDTKYDVASVTTALNEVASLTHDAAQEIAAMKIGRATLLEFDQ